MKVVVTGKPLLNADKHLPSENEGKYGGLLYLFSYKTVFSTIEWPQISLNQSPKILLLDEFSFQNNPKSRTPPALSADS